jgi:hypothetical protein|tara:strand:- start:1101 stop:1298 length:198 start_codon:yes stop_codon:yes gene_type:complete
MTDKLSNSVTSSFDDELYAFAKADASLMGVDVSTYIRATLIEKREKRFSELSVFQDLMPIKKINK